MWNWISKLWRKSEPVVVAEESPFTKADRLLRRYLTPQQLRDLDAHHQFRCVGELTRMEYVLERGHVVLLYHELSGSETYPARHYWSFCLVAEELDIPDPDRLLTIKLLIELDEMAFFRMSVFGDTYRWVPPINSRRITAVENKLIHDMDSVNEEFMPFFQRLGRTTVLRKYLKSQCEAKYGPMPKAEYLSEGIPRSLPWE